MLLSVIIPTLNRSRYVADLLDSLSLQEKVKYDWEVIVVDNNSIDNTSSTVEEKKKKLPIDIRYVCETNFGLHSGRHRGAVEAKGKYIAYLDDDTTVVPQWIKGVQLLEQGSADAVVGKILPKWECQAPKWIKLLNNNGILGYLALLNLGDQIKKVDPSLVFGCNFFIARKLILKLGGFNPDGMPSDKIRFRGDGETGFMKKFKKEGLVSYYDPISTVYHIINKNRLTKNYLEKRFFYQGISDSFSEIRAKYFGNPGVDNSKILKINLRKRISSKIKRSIKAIYNLAVYEKEKREIIKIKEKGYREGYRFHQNEVKKDPKLFEWVIKDNYLK